MNREKQFNDLYRDHRQQVYRLCLGYFGGDHDVAEDAVQETFMNVWRSLDGFREEARLTTWLYRIAVNTCLLFLRRKSRRKETYTDSLPPTAEDHSEGSAQEEKLEQLYRCISRLQEADRMAILLVLEGVSYREIGEVTGISEDTLRVRLHRIKKTLTQCVNHGNL